MCVRVCVSADLGLLIICEVERGVFVPERDESSSRNSLFSLERIKAGNEDDIVYKFHFEQKKLVNTRLFFSRGGNMYNTNVSCMQVLILSKNFTLNYGSFKTCGWLQTHLSFGICKPVSVLC